MEREITKMIRVYGIVQGVGFRPTVSRHAMARGIRGSVSNKGPYVEIFAQGKQQDVDAFIADIGNKPPKRAAILKLLEEPVEEPEKFTQFDIIESEKTKGEIFVSPDIAICDECKAEMFDPENRRYLHPFINCTCCGPRLTILDSLPYDRERTSMKEFPPVRMSTITRIPDAMMPSRCAVMTAALRYTWREERNGDGRLSLIQGRSLLPAGSWPSKGSVVFTFAVMLPVRRLYSGCGSGNGVR